jgi:3-oxoacyl-[acyl-carrier protein] reductase
MSDISLHGKVIVVTGGGRGLGLAMVRGLAAAGADVVVPTHIQSDVHDLSQSAAQPEGGGSVRPIHVNLRDPGQCEDAVSGTIAQFGKIHGLINNAGVAPAFIAPDHNDPDQPRPKFWDTDDDIVQTVLETNYIAANRMASLVAPHMVAAGWGRIINVTTMIETMHRPGFSCYGASKAALEMASEIWHQDMAGTGVTVNILNPGGPADTEGLALARREATRRGVMGPLVEPEKMAAPAIWLCSDDSDGISGMRYDADPWDATQPPATEAERIGRPLGLRLIPRA